MTITAKPPKPRFKKGDAVHIDDRKPRGHCRTPWYLRGKIGVVASVQGVYHDPALLAYHKPGLPATVLYKVRFLQSEVWPISKGHATYHREADNYEYWLEPATEERRP